LRDGRNQAFEAAIDRRSTRHRSRGGVNRLLVERLVLAGVFDRHPGLQVIIGQMGEMLPVMIDRATGLLDPISELPRSVRDYLTGHVHLTIAGVYSPPAFAAAVQTFGIDRLMFSTDYPYVPGMPARRFFETVPLALADRRRLAGENAAALLGLSIPSPAVDKPVGATAG